MKHLIVPLLLVASTTPSVACLYTERTVEELVIQSKTVFRARVTEVRLALMVDPKTGRSNEVVEARYEIKEVFKGTPPALGIIRDAPFRPGGCGLGLNPGFEYVLFPDENEMVMAPTGSFGYFNPEGPATKPRLALIRKLAASLK